MGNKIALEKKDRIVEINGFKLFVHDDHKPNRKNVICYSNSLQLYITSNRLNPDSTEHVIRIGNLISNKTFTDIEVVKVKGYY